MPTAAKPTYHDWIIAIRQIKGDFTTRKVETRGTYDNDDHGWIPWPEPVDFKVKPNNPCGRAFGIKAIGENFRTWLSKHPAFIFPKSALAGAWVGAIPDVGGWPPEDRPVHLRELHEKYHLKVPGIGAMNHIGGDLRIGLDLGWGGILAKIRRYRELNRPMDTSFYDGEEQVVLGIQEWISRHVEAAREMAERERDPLVRMNLLEIADMNEWLVGNPPRNLREACQFLAWFQSVDRMYFMGGAGGQLDELLRPYYEADQAAGIGDDEAIIWAIVSLFFNDTHYYQIGGPHPADGHDMTSPISFLILEAFHRLHIPSNLAVRLHRGLDPKLLRRSVEYLLEDGTAPSYSCDKGIVEGFMKNGIPLGLARMRAKVGCNWTALPGIEYCLQDVTRLCLVKPFLLAFEEMMAEPGSPKSMDALWRRYTDHLSISVDTIKRGFDWHMARHSKNSPEIIYNLFSHGTIERGLDVAAGGVDLVNLTCDGVGLATAADSFAAVEQRVVQEGLLTWEELAQHLSNDYAGAEDVRLMLKNIARYGTGGTRADFWAKQIAEAYARLMKDTPTPNGYNIIPGLFSHGTVHMLGQGLGATPNGRHANTEISHSADPDPGFLPGGGTAPTAKSNAVAGVQPGYGNSAPLQLDIDIQLARAAGGIEAVEALLRSHEAQGGTLININVISKEQLLEAHEDPMKYPDLVVRVTGYSTYFRCLSKPYRQQIVDRILSL